MMTSVSRLLAIFVAAVFLPTSLLAQVAAEKTQPLTDVSPKVQKVSQDSRREIRINFQQNTPVENDFLIGPARFLLTMRPGETKTVELQVTNRTGHEGVFEFLSEDFDIDPKTNLPRFYASQVGGPFAASNWIHPEVGSVVLRHGDRAFVNVTVMVPAGAEPGDHQAAMIVKLRDKPSKQSGIGVVSRAASMFVITVPGKVLQDTKVDSILVRHFLNWSYPVFLRLSATNRGNVIAAPTGTVTIRNLFGVAVDEVPVREWYILRGQTRPIDLTWSPRFALGRYTAETKVKIYAKQTVPASVTFWVLPIMPVLLLLFTIFFVSFLIQYVFSRFELRKKKSADAALK